MVLKTRELSLYSLCAVCSTQKLAFLEELTKDST